VLPTGGDGFRLGRPLSLDVDHQPRDVAVGDLDRDGRDKVVVLDGPTAVVLREHDGELERDQRLETPADVPSTLGQWRLALADVDGDQWTDVVTWLSRDKGRASSLVLHRNDGSRRFSSSVIATMDGGLGGVAVADFDGDGDVDIVAVGTERTLHVLRNRGDGRFDAGTQPRRQVGGQKLIAADVNADGRLDLVVSAEYSSEAAKYPGDLWVRLNLGDLWFSDAQRLARPRTLLAVADLNGDRRADFVVDDIPEVVVLTSGDC
jgi:hypothetical protein